MNFHTIVLLALLSCFLSACAEPINLENRQTYWQRHLENRFETPQSPDQLIEWLQDEGAVFADYNQQGKVLSVLEVLPGDGVEFSEHMIMLVAEVESPEIVGPFYIFVANGNTSINIAPAEN